MLEDGKINRHQFKVYVVLVFIGTAILIAPSALAAKAKQDAWIAAIIGVALGILVIALYNSIANKMKNRTLIEYIEATMGKWLGKIVAIWYVVFFLLATTTIVWIIGNFMSSQIMTSTPELAFNILFVIVIVIGTRLGLEVIVRTAEILYPVAIGGTIILFLLIIPDINFKNVQPILENGIRPLFESIMVFESFVPFTFICFLMIFPRYMKDIEEGKKGFLAGMITGGIIIVIQTALTILVLGPESTVRNTYPSYVVAKKIKIGIALERIESIIAMVWIISVFFKAILYFYSGVLGMAQIFKLKDYKVLTLPLGMIVVVLSTIVYPNSIYANKWDTTVWTAYLFTNGLIIPFLLLIIGRIKR